MPEPLDPTRFHVLTTKQIKLYIAILVTALLVFVPTGSYFYYKWAIHRPSQTDKEIKFEIKNGQSVSETAKILADQGAINSEFLFNMYVFVNKYDTNIQAGVYTIKAGTDIVDLVSMFQHGVSDTSVTFLEGWRVEEFSRKAASLYNKIDYTHFANLAKDHEGYLFPDTYTFSNDLTEEQLLNILLKTFDEKTANILTADNLSKVKLTKEQAVILASIVEREVSNPVDRPIVAGILLNRFRLGMKIDADATTQYAIALSRLCKDVTNGICAAPLKNFYDFNWWPKDLTLGELDSDSPYNTRKALGLPPKPICSPGLSSIEAAVHPVDTQYLYYLHDSQGVIHYATTLEEHNDNVARFLY